MVLRGKSITQAHVAGMQTWVFLVPEFSLPPQVSDPRKNSHSQVRFTNILSLQDVIKEKSKAQACKTGLGSNSFLLLPDSSRVDQLQNL